MLKFQGQNGDFCDEYFLLDNYRVKTKTIVDEKKLIFWSHI